ncbi:surface protein [Aquimarina sp. EL_43]|uniref:BspA family leucine-rich repeat surface protein n=1 Tax=unclassified Aquimarina TaxID=2627091 RepID=UPI0018C8E920|nr:MULTISPECIES: BspA family leucine-rich repeat surface protein [unclassified Aquimarina]MBG6132548.1 surface protein [Aquimarina sp. EL_35]MBG6152679.1 surface protein [Aquimarina sp. EL_32]MBG6170686.1 surface protein [Aquimarina sp. EL_43]
MKKRKQIKVSVLAMLMMVVLSVGCSKDDDAQPQPVVNKAPVISAQTFTVAENIADDVVIGTVAATDPEQASITFELTQNSNDLFELTDAGELSLVAGKKLDFETNATYTITVEVSDGTHKASAEITISLENVAEPFITTWKTTAANEEIIFQLNDELTYNFTIDWGDGTIEANVTTTPKHTYVEPGVHTVSVSGVLPAVQFKDKPGEVEGDGAASNAAKLETIEQWGDNEWESFAEAFIFCENMTYNAKDIPNLSKVTELHSMFYGCAKFNGDINNWDVSTITTMRRMFSNTSSFNKDLDQWDVSNVTDMRGMFSNATLFNGNISTWNVGKVEKMSSMFFKATSFNGNISAWNVGKVTNMSSMFNGSTAFNGDINQWNVGSVTDMGSMFSEATSFNKDLSNWNVANVTSMRYMFAIASSFNQDLSKWDVSNVTTMEQMFSGAVAFNGEINIWDVSNVTLMAGMFSNATSFNGDIGKWNVSKVTNMMFMFSNATSFNAYLGNWNVSNVAFMRGLFYKATSFNQDLRKWDVSKVTVMDRMLDDTNLSNDNYDNLLIEWSKLPNIQSNVTLGAKGLEYCNGNVERNTLIVVKGWTIIGDVAKICPR